MEGGEGKCFVSISEVAMVVQEGRRNGKSSDSVGIDEKVTLVGWGAVLLFGSGRW